MKICTFINADQETKVGALVTDNRIVELNDFYDMKDFISRYCFEKQNIQKTIEATLKFYNTAEVNFKAPILNPSKMIFIGLNYREHAIESKLPVPEKPILFAKFSNSIVGHTEDVIITRETSQCDYEAELAFIVGKKAKNVLESDAMDYIFGYTACNDISARELQLKEGGQWLRGKAVDTFAPIGPVIVTSDEMTDPHNLSIKCLVNGEMRQNSNTNELIFNVPYLLSFLSRTITLEPGDFVSTGTPSGVAIGMKTPIWLKAGDVCEVEIEGIGKLENKMVSE